MGETERKKGLRRWLNTEFAIFALAVGFIITIHQEALQDRLVLILYFLATAGAAYALVRRHAFGYAATTVAATAATIFASAYYSAKPDHWHPVIDPIRDVAGLGLLLFLTVRVLVELYRFQKREKEREFHQIVEKKTVEMRAAALRSTSHEVRTPLTTITAVVDMLLDEDFGPLTDMQREYVTDIDDAAQHLLSLVNDILDFAKAEAGLIRLAPQPVALVELIQQCVEMVEAMTQTAGVTISVHIAPELQEIVADPLRLKQMLLNLLTNAVKYNQRDGTVTVRVRPQGDDHVLFSVRDSGRGIKPEHMEHLFDPYYQAAVADQGIGTGLGLAIIKHLVDLHGGELTVESSPGTGSVFTVLLPKVTTVDYDVESNDESPSQEGNSSDFLPLEQEPSVALS